MITPEERESIIQEAAKRILLLLPETIGNLMASQAAASKLTSKFYAQYPEFKDKKNIVASVVEMVEGNNPLLPYDKILEMAVPEIRNRLSIVSKMDVNIIPQSPKRDLKNVVNNTHGIL